MDCVALSLALYLFPMSVCPTTIFLVAASEQKLRPTNAIPLFAPTLALQARTLRPDRLAWKKP